ncbi:MULTISPECIES: CaiB/BaiF CoA-transferase family protein [Rhodococcus]|uniref:CoA transferase n=1 Tax=Rhodococcus aetherivorans TaxID=191292 RepID=A0AA46NV43_9NOCA|nr:MULTISPECIES: CaiB/BaiF CoA-transferase family protein [Rhodococcus]AKE88217.1 carnitine dehydratase [Rhodococcus aetherivorans]ANZ27156.1 carnitine dehydratase [Rhodococcus sp. WB1]MBC2592251.1 CoA transferase [Rhodococcus aetherivorans]QIX48489.1 CoA transferase [Rhodococcus sp. DMU1]USC15770.1 CoA transferase [Rhodococcus sp. 11-3]
MNCDPAASRGPLTGVRVLELGGIGPAPFAGMLLGDMGAEVIRVDRPGEAGRNNPFPVLHRNRRSITVDLKDRRGAGLVLDLARGVDAVIEGFRPGVAERLGLGPDNLFACNPALVYGRMTGWGQDGPLAQEPGHDINFIALTGVLEAIGTHEEPLPPLNLVGDMGGGMFLALGVLGAVMNARAGGCGQVVDAAMCDGSATMMAMVYDFWNAGRWNVERGTNGIDGGSPCYGVYRCVDDRHVALGIGDERSYAALLDVLGLAEDPTFADRQDSAEWPRMRKTLAALFAQRERDTWAQLFAGRGASFSPVLDLVEAPHHPHNQARQTFLVGPGGTIEPAPTPRFSGTPLPRPIAAPVLGADTDAVLVAAGVLPERIDELRAAGVVA